MMVRVEMPSRDQNSRFKSKSEIKKNSPPTPKKSSFQQKFYATFISPIKFFLIRLRELFFGRTDKQMSGDKPSYLGKKMLFLLGIFTLTSFILFAEMNQDLFANEMFVSILTFLTLNNPYTFGITLTFVFIELSLLNCNDKIHQWFFGKLYIVKQLLLFGGLFVGNFFLFKNVLTKGFDFYSILLIFAGIWLIFQTIRIFNGAKHGATKAEAKISERYSPFLFFIAVITPFIILGFLIFLSWIFRYYIVIFTLDYIGHPDHNPQLALEIYTKEMGVIMPMIYTGMFFVFVMMIAQVILSRKKGATKRAGAYDNFTFGLISFVMFLYSLYNIALYLFLDHKFLEGFGTVLGSTSHSGSAFFIEYLITIIFLIWIIIDLHQQFEKGVLFFTKDGMVLFLLGAIFAQTTARYGIVSGIANINTTFANFIKYDYMILPWIILLFLGITIVSYWIRPQEMSMFLHMSKSAVNDKDKAMENILRFLKREFIRRGEKFLISPEIINSLKKITGYPSQVIWSLIYRLNDQYIDVHLHIDKDENQNKIVFFDFLPITTRYSKSKEAEYRAKTYLSSYFVQSLQQGPKKNLAVSKKKISSSKQTDVFIQSLSHTYAKKVQTEKEYKEKILQKGEQFTEELLNRAMDEETKKLVYEIVKKEYIRRITHITDFPNEIRFRMSDIVGTIEKSTGIPIGRVFPLLYQLAAENWNFMLSADFIDAKHPDDRLIEFLPIDDWELYSLMREYRPEALREIHVLMQTWFDRNIHHKRKNLKRLPPLEYQDEDAEFERSYRSKWFAQTMHYFAKYFQTREKEQDFISRTKILIKSLKLLGVSHI